MKINTNMIGNYSPHIAHNVNSTGKTKETSPKFELQNVAPNKAENLTSEEKNFFADMYPDKKNEITDHHFYNRSGEMSGVKIGSIIDRRG